MGGAHCLLSMLIVHFGGSVVEMEKEKGGDGRGVKQGSLPGGSEKLICVDESNYFQPPCLT